MNLNQSTKWISFLLSFAFVFFMACNNDDENNLTLTDEEQSVYEAEESTESFFEVVESITTSAIQYAGTNAGGRIAESTDPEIACATILFEGNATSGRVEINFGEGCEGPDGKVRSGIVVVEYEGNWLSQGAVTWTVLKDFYVDGLKVEGTRTVTNKAFDQSEMILTQTVKIDNGKVIWPDETFITRTSERTHKLKVGDSFNDIELEVSGIASGTTRAGHEYSAETIEPLVFKSMCRGSIYLPASGIKTITIPELTNITVDYGDGSCDNKFMVIMDRGKKEITL